MAMFNLPHSTNSIFSGGNYTQVTTTNLVIQQQTPWDRLQSAAVPSAFHDAGGHFDAPKCHHNTRVAVLSELRDFALRRGDTGQAKILWLNGAAGAGKSAIARSLCEECASTDSLLASFFFSRSDAFRDNDRAFVATIAYQIYGNIPPHNQTLILEVIERDPLVFTRSVDAQFQALVTRPLHDLFENGYFFTNGKRLIVIDGLDECSTSAAQLNILRVIQNMSNRTEFPFTFLIASRPEHELQTFFRSSRIVPLLHRLELDDSYLPDVDIERFLVDKLQETRDIHPFRNSIPDNWPPTSSIQALVNKSSGQFIYASVVVKYVTSTRHQPHKRLDYVLTLCPPKGDLPFAELDALYSHILSCAEGDITLALRLVGFHDMAARTTVGDLARLLRSDPNDFLAAFCDLWSVMTLHTDLRPDHIAGIKILHKSFLDFLFDSTRSGKYHIDKSKLRAELAVECIRYVSLKEIAFIPGGSDTHLAAMSFLGDHADDCQFMDNISFFYESLASFSLTNVYNMFLPSPHRSNLHRPAFFEFFDKFFAKLMDGLSSLNSTIYPQLYKRQVSDFFRLYNQHPIVYFLRLEANTDGGMEDALIMTTLLILCERPEFRMPDKVLRSRVGTLLENPIVNKAHHTAQFGIAARGIIHLLHDAALQCFNFLKSDVNPPSVNVTLAYLTWVLPYAAQSSQLNAACTPTRPFAYTEMRDASQADTKLAQQVATDMEGYKARYAQYLLREEPCTT